MRNNGKMRNGTVGLSVRGGAKTSDERAIRGRRDQREKCRGTHADYTCDELWPSFTGQAVD